MANNRIVHFDYVDVASIDASLERAANLGAKVALPKTPVPGVGAVAAIIDPQGNICGLWEQAEDQQGENGGDRYETDR